MQISDVRMWGRDYSAREWTPEQLDAYERANPRERPVQFLRRYIGYPTNPKCISAYNGMYRRHWEAGRPVGLFHQIGYTDMEGGYDRGRQHALVAKADAEGSRVGWRGESHIVACMDRFYAKAGYRTLTAGDLSEYMRGFRSVLGDRTGFYGFYDSMRDAINGGWASYFVQCGARSAHVPGIHEWQENNYQPRIDNVATDILELYATPEYAFSRRAPGGGGTQQQEGNDMFFVGHFDAEKNAWVSNERFLVHGNHFTGGFTEADVNAARADAKNGPIPLFGVSWAVLDDMRKKGDLAMHTLDTLREVNEKLAKLAVGGVDTAKLTADLNAGLSKTLPGAVVAEFKKEGN